MRQLDLVRLIQRRRDYERYYQKNRGRLLEYHRRHWRHWGKTKRFAKATGMPLHEARRYIGYKMQKWFFDRGILVRVFPRKSVASERVARRLRPLDKDDQYAR